MVALVRCFDLVLDGLLSVFYLYLFSSPVTEPAEAKLVLDFLCPADVRMV